MRKALLIAALSVCTALPAMAEDAVVVVDDHGKPMEEVKAEIEAATDEAQVQVFEVEVKTPAATPHETPHTVDWGYTSGGGAYKWAELNSSYELCGSGAMQSPININQFVQEDLPALELTYSPVPLVVENNGHTVQVNYAPGSSFSIGGKAYALQQFHFHTPSEHYIDGAPYPMEAHFVHKAEDGSLAVVGVTMKVGAHNPVIEGIWQNVPQAGEIKSVNMVELSADDLMPEDKSYYSYDGSLTTPPCSEGVSWYVLKDPIEISEKQLTAFQAVFPVNARPVQALGDRSVKGN